MGNHKLTAITIITRNYKMIVLLLSLWEVDMAIRVQVQNEDAEPLGKGKNLTILPPAMGNIRVDWAP